MADRQTDGRAGADGWTDTAAANAAQVVARPILNKPVGDRVTKYSRRDYYIWSDAIRYLIQRRRRYLHNEEGLYSIC